MTEFPVRVGLIGAGAIGRRVTDGLLDGAVSGARLSAVLVRDPVRQDLGPEVLSTSVVDEFVAACDLVVEAAGQAALVQYAAPVLTGGADLLALSVGALRDPGRLAGLGPGRLLVCPGAIAGVDLLRAVALSGGFTRLKLTTEKKPLALIQPWMDDVLRDRLTSLGEDDEPVELYRGSVSEAALLYPSNLNLAVTVALASRCADLEVVLVVRAGLPRTRHTLEGVSAIGRYRLELEHEPLADQPRTSAVVPAAVLVSIDDYVRGSGDWWSGWQSPRFTGRRLR